MAKVLRLEEMYVWLLSCVQLFCSLPGSSGHGDYPGMNTGVGSYSLLQEIFPTQELNLGLLYLRQILYHLSHQGSPKVGGKRTHKHKISDVI